MKTIQKLILNDEIEIEVEITNWQPEKPATATCAKQPEVLEFYAWLKIEGILNNMSRNYSGVFRKILIRNEEKLEEIERDVLDILRKGDNG